MRQGNLAVAVTLPSCLANRWSSACSQRPEARIQKIGEAVQPLLHAIHLSVDDQAALTTKSPEVLDSRFRPPRFYPFLRESIS